jgi:hypothetical protein
MRMGVARLAAVATLLVLLGGLLGANLPAAWTATTSNDSGAATALPVGQDVYKLAVDADGIYEITYEALQAAGMDVESVNPQLFQLLHDGLPVAYRLTGNGDDLFEPGESVLFYGWAFDGSRRIRQYVNENIFWLWAGASPSHFAQISSISGTSSDFFYSTITREEDRVWAPTRTDQWAFFDNEPDAWYWEQMHKPDAAPITVTQSITLPNPVPWAGSATYLAELTSYPAPPGNPHRVEVHLNSAAMAEGSWVTYNNVNITGEIDAADLIDGQNQVDVVLATAAPVHETNQPVYLNRITVNYPRYFRAVGDELHFEDQHGGARQFEVADFEAADVEKLLIWRLADRYQPVSIDPYTVSVTGSGPYTVTFGSDHPAGTPFIATSRDNLRQPVYVEKYVPVDLDPPAGGTEWLAISHGDFLAETHRLAAHRSHPFFGGLDTYVVDVRDVIDQYGYGVPSPLAIERYLSHAMSWTTVPQFVLLVGDATVDARGKVPTWTDQPFVPVDLPFVDRFQGQIPSDYVYSLVSGGDLIPDIAVGRLPARTEPDMAAMVDKIITYEENQLEQHPWRYNALFVSDGPDGFTDFCNSSATLAQRVPATFSVTQLCMAARTEEAAQVVRPEMFHHVNEVKAPLLSYRGHGNVPRWSNNLLTIWDMDQFYNVDVPFFGVSADCLDGFFAYPPTQGLGETLMRHLNGGAAGYWSSSGLGYPSEHSVLEDALFEGLFELELPTIGEAINYAKAAYLASGNHESLVYTFNLMGDPAMRLYSIDPLPLAGIDIYEMSGGLLQVPAPGVLSNDFNPGQGPLTAVLEVAPQNGQLTLNPDGSFSYTMTSPFTGLDTFSYRSTTQSGTYAIAEVYILANGWRTYLPLVTSLNDN